MQESTGLLPNFRLQRLSKYLNYEISSTVLIFLSFQFIGVIFLAVAAAIIFTPFMLYVLYKESRKGWIISFACLIALPFIVLLIGFLMFDFSKGLLYIPLGMFYFYCFLLRMEVNNWVREFDAKRHYLLERQRQKDEMDIFMKQFEQKS